MSEDVTAAMVESVSAGLSGSAETASGSAPEGTAGETAQELSGEASEDAGSTGLEDDAAGAIVPPGSREPGIPLSRHKAIMANTRKKTEADLRTSLRQEYEKEFRGQYGLSEGVDAVAVREMLAARAWMERDPRGYASFVASQVLGSDWQQPGQPAPTKAEAKAIEAKLRAESGEAIYTADQIQELLATERQAWKQELMSEFRPVMEDHAQRQLQAQSSAKASQILSAYRQKPHFTDLEPKIKAYWGTHPALSLAEAYAETLATELPALLVAKTAEVTSATTLARKAVASETGVGRGSPSAGATPAQSRPILDVIRETHRDLGGGR